MGLRPSTGRGAGSGGPQGTAGNRRHHRDLRGLAWAQVPPGQARSILGPMSRTAPLSLFLAVLAPAQGAVERPSEDLAETLPKRHEAPFTLIEEGRWRQEVRELEERLPDLDNEAAFEVELLKLVALLGDSHTRPHPKALLAGAQTIPPDHLGSQSYADFITGEDPVLDRTRALAR